MNTIKLYCKKCNVALTNELTEILKSEINWKDNENSIPSNRFVNFISNSKETILVAIEPYFLTENSINRDNGCCGNSNSESFNKICKNGHEVATKIDDCCTGFYIEFDCEKIKIKETNKNNFTYAK